MTKKLFAEIYGWYGTIAILTAYMLVSFNLISSSSSLYQFLNLTGAGGVITISLIKKAYQPAILNIIWALIALLALLKAIKLL